jgi:hypothetical protein
MPPLPQSGGALPATGSQALGERPHRAADHPVLPPAKALPPVLLAALRIKALGQGQPARVGRG